ncbi:MAG: 50S ribosomal protein L18 [Bacteroidetes bacterium SW_11_64_17]|jgi:large subunit ribosomal protein L18|nr:MAG: 50S ribosomal protein L18 [Bacteroidetes bacterium SW_11_64_17]
MPKGKKEKVERRQRIHDSIRESMFGTSVRPRLSVYRSNRYIYAQLVDDLEGRTLASASSLADDVDGDTPTEESRAVGELLAERADESGIEKAVFDRSGYKYHGRIEALAEGAREGGLQL